MNSRPNDTLKLPGLGESFEKLAQDIANPAQGHNHTTNLIKYTFYFT